VDRSEALERPGWEGRPVAIPDDVDDPAIVKASGRIKLPRHVYWSGEDPQGKEWDLDDPRQRELVYRMVMIEGTEDDVRRFIDVDGLIAMWPSLFLPKRIRAAWEVWLRQRHGTRL
jgi:hypothetical protein